MLRQKKDWLPGHMTTHLDQGACPACGTVLKMATDVDEGVYATPKPGSFCVCINCCALNILDDEMKLRTPTEAEIALATTDPEFKRLYTIVMRDHATWKARS